MKRKIISVMLTGTMIAGMLTGCGSDSSSKSSSSVISGSSETETETTEADESDDKTPVTFEYFNADGKNGNWDNPVAKAITRRLVLRWMSAIRLHRKEMQKRMLR